MPTRTRLASAQDLEAVLPIIAAFHAEEHLATTPASRHAAVNRLLVEPRRGRILLAFETGPQPTLVGYAVLCLGFSIEFGGIDAFVDELYVVPARRGQGIGQQLLQDLQATAREAGVVALHLEVDDANPRARDLYLRQGYDLHPRRLMTKRLG